MGRIDNSDLPGDDRSPAEPRNQSRVAAVIMLQGLDGECDQSFCRGEVSEGITVLRWFDRGPWSFDAVDPAAVAGEGAAG